MHNKLAVVLMLNNQHPTLVDIMAAKHDSSLQATTWQSLSCLCKQSAFVNIMIMIAGRKEEGVYAKSEAHHIVGIV